MRFGAARSGRRHGRRSFLAAGVLAWLWAVDPARPASLRAVLPRLTGCTAPAADRRVPPMPCCTAGSDALGSIRCLRWGCRWPVWFWAGPPPPDRALPGVSGRAVLAGLLLFGLAEFPGRPSRSPASPSGASSRPAAASASTAPVRWDQWPIPALTGGVGEFLHRFAASCSITSLPEGGASSRGFRRPTWARSALARSASPLA